MTRAFASLFMQERKKQLQNIFFALYFFLSAIICLAFCTRLRGSSRVQKATTAW
jgi:hypothetical protein